LFLYEDGAEGASMNMLAARCLAEAVGTFILVFFGCGVVHAAVLTNAQSGLWQVAIVWGVAIMAAVYVVGGISGAHINPAITIAAAVWGKHPWHQVGPYILAQLTGAFIAAAALFTLFSPFLLTRESENKVTRGQPGSEITAMCYGEYFPNPGLDATTKLYIAGETDKLRALVSEPVAFGAEVIGTLLLALVVFAVTDERNNAAPQSRLAPVFIGLTVAILISVIAPLTQACFNPARDFGPRLFACVAGWGRVAIPGPSATGFFTVYIFAPILGAVLGGGLYQRVLRTCLPPAIDERKTLE
jgi:glycerol uptake facilitator protein